MALILAKESGKKPAKNHFIASENEMPCKSGNLSLALKE
jgi:hypothetical protein